MSRPLEINAECETSFRCMPWDLDIFLELNNGRVLTLFDLGRFNLAIRTGLGKILKEKSWGLVVAGSTIRYRRRVKMFEKIIIRTQVVAFEEQWIYIVQSMWVKGQPASSVLLRTGITSKGKVIHSDEVLDVMGISGLKQEPSEWLKAWIVSEEIRPWPPSC